MSFSGDNLYFNKKSPWNDNFLGSIIEKRIVWDGYAKNFLKRIKARIKNSLQKFCITLNCVILVFQNTQISVLLFRDKRIIVRDRIKTRKRTAKTSLNNRYTLRRPDGRLRAPKNRSRATPLVRFFSDTFGAGVIAPQCPITRPKRRIPKR